MGVIAIADTEKFEEEVLHRYKFPSAELKKYPDGIWIFEAGGVGTRLVKHPIECVALVFDEANTIAGRVLKFHNDFKNCSVEIFCEQPTLARSDSFERFLIQHGVKIPTEEYFLKPQRTAASLLRSYLLATNPSLHISLRSLSGWVPNRDGFLLGTEALGEGPSEQPAPSPKYRSKFGEDRTAFRTHGTVDEWKTHCAEPCIESPVWVTSILAAFAGPLLSLLGLGEHSGGFHFYGHSSTGKTIALKLAASVYGQEVVPWRITSNALEALAALHSDRVLVLDEILQANPRDVMAAIYMLSNRRGKVRMTENIQLRTTFAWQLLFISTGEISVEDIAAKARTEYYEGQALRFLSIPMVEKKLSRKSVTALERSINCLHGTVGRAWVNFLLKNNKEKGKEWRTQYDQTVDEHIKLWDSKDARLNRVLHRVAILETAGAIAHANGFLPDSFYAQTEYGNVARNSLKRVVHSWCEGTGVGLKNGSLSDTKKAASRLLEAVNVGISNRWLVPFSNNEFTQKPGFKTLGFIDETDPKDKTVFVLESVLRASCIPPGVRAFTNELKEAGALLPDQSNRGRLKTRMKAIGGEFGLKIDRSVSAYAFSLNQLEQYAAVEEPPKEIEQLNLELRSEDEQPRISESGASPVGG